MDGRRDTNTRDTNNSEQRERAELLGHDIRNAVSDILGGLSLADLAPLDTSSRQQLLRVRSASEQLARLADEALALVCGDTALETNIQANVRFAPLLDAVEAHWAAHGAERGLVFTLHRSNDLPQAIGVTKGRLERILSNVIGNAIKYTGKGKVTLGVRLEAQETLCFCVRDQGPGFSDAALARLFERHARDPNTHVPGSGLGLLIVRDLVDQIGGHMTIGNHRDGGANVAVRLPRPAWAPGVHNPTAKAELPDLSGLYVLVAEDNETNQLLVRQMLDTLGARCHVAADGQEALDLLRAQHFDLALIDIEMPRLSGLDLIRALRAGRCGAPNLPVLAITAYVLSANRAEIYDAGTDGILAKPIMSIEAFGQAIAAILEKRDVSHQDTPDAPTAPKKADDVYSSVHLDRLLALAGADGGRELLLRLRQDFDAVRKGLETGLAEQDCALLRARTHVLISLAGAVGADQLQDCAEKINAAAHSGNIDVAKDFGPFTLTCLQALDTRLAQEFVQRYGPDDQGETR